MTREDIVEIKEWIHRVMENPLEGNAILSLLMRREKEGHFEPNALNHRDTPRSEYSRSVTIIREDEA